MTESMQETDMVKFNNYLRIIKEHYELRAPETCGVQGKPDEDGLGRIEEQADLLLQQVGDICAYVEMLELRSSRLRRGERGDGA